MVGDTPSINLAGVKAKYVRVLRDAPSGYGVNFWGVGLGEFRIFTQTSSPSSNGDRIVANDYDDIGRLSAVRRGVGLRGL